MAASLLTGTAANAAPAAPGTGVGAIDFEAGRYIVTLAEPAVAAYEGGVPGIPATAPEEGEQFEARRAPVVDYRAHLQQKQQEVAAEADVTIDSSYTVAINAFAADLSAEQAAALSTDRDVLYVVPDELKKIQAETGTEFLGLDGPGGVWEAVGGAETAGEGVVVGILDTGIAPENPSFAGEPLGTEPGAEPYRDGDSIVFEKSDGGTFTSECVEGVQFTADDCSTKIIGARYFVDGFGADRIGDASTGPGEFLSPRDGDGHGSHTGGTAAGNHRVETTVSGIDFGPISGVAPAAKIAAYKVCWNGPDATVTTDDGCATSDLLAGIDQAVLDGVDVINYSIGGGAATTTYSPTDDAFLGAAAAGVFVAASAGNSGPAASTLDNASPWITTVAASTIPAYQGTVTLGDGQAFPGASITVDMSEDAEPLTGPLVSSRALAAAGAPDPELCGPGTLDPELVAEGDIVLCERGVYDRVAKSAEVARVGGAGMVLVNVTPGSVDTDTHSVPTVHLDADYYEAVTAYAGTEGATATLTAGNSTDVVTPVPQVAGFSSRGPVLADGSDILKPDISAPGVSILAAVSNREGEDPAFGFLSGTSMSSPHIAGLAALYLGERPNATPAEIKSAIMTTAYDTLAADGSTVTDPFTQGAGHADPTRFFEPGLVYLNGVPDWLGYLQGIGYNAGVEPIDGSDLNLASIAVGTLTAPEQVTRTVTATQAGTFEASIQGLAGIEATVEPSTLTFGAAGESQEFTVTFARTDAALDAYASGSLTWTSGETTVRSPIVVQPVTIVAPAMVEGEGTTGSVDIAVTPGGTGDIALSTTGLSLGERLPNAADPEAENSGSGVTGDFAEYVVTVPEGSAFTRFDLDSADDTADLDLIVYQLDAAGTPIAGWQSATGSADERVDLVEPEAGDYAVIVDVYSAATETAWDMSVTSIVEGGAPLALDPAVIAGVQGEEAIVTASWADLEAQSTYLGLVRYGDTGAVTTVQVETGDAPVEPEEPVAPVAVVAPSISGEAKAGRVLTADPGEWDVEGLTFTYQWQANGEDIRRATESTYRVTGADRGDVITVVVTASKEGLPNGTATSEGVRIPAAKVAATVSLDLSRTIAFSWQTTTARIVVDSEAEAAPTGTVTVRADGRVIARDVALSAEGTASVTLPRSLRGLVDVQATYSGDAATKSARSDRDWVWIVF